MKSSCLLTSLAAAVVLLSPVCAVQHSRQLRGAFSLHALLQSGNATQKANGTKANVTKALLQSGSGNATQKANETKANVTKALLQSGSGNATQKANETKANVTKALLQSGSGNATQKANVTKANKTQAFLQRKVIETPSNATNHTNKVNSTNNTLKVNQTLSGALLLKAAPSNATQKAVSNATQKERLTSPPAYSRAVEKSAVGSGATSMHVEAKAEDEKLLPVGEGAYQSAKAVEQRTTDKKKACEDGKWKDCWKTGGDFVDGHTYGSVPQGPAPTTKSSATTVGLSLATAMGVALLTASA